MYSDTETRDLSSLLLQLSNGATGSPDVSSLFRAEFNLFNWRTSGEEVADEEWNVVEQNFPLTSNNELTLDGFLTLHQMEAEDNQGDPRELRVTVQVDKS